MGHEHLQTLTVGKHVGQVKSVAMSRSCTVKQFAVMVDRCRAIYDFVTSVSVDITDSEAVGAFPVKLLDRLSPTYEAFSVSLVPSKSTAHTYAAV